MTQAAEKIRGFSVNLEEIQARNSEIVVHCEKHGDFSRGDIIQHGLHRDECPMCRQEAQNAWLRDQKIKEAARFFQEKSGVPARFQAAGFDNYRPESTKAERILTTLRDYVSGFEQHRRLGLSLILCGKTGTGKTHLACAVLRELALLHGVHGKYSTAYRAVQEIRSSYKSDRVTELQALEEFIRPDILVLDEIGMQLGTDSENLLLFSLLNGRYEELKPTLVISNLTLKEVKDYLNDRVYDRLRENCGGVLAFDWESWRQKGGRL